MDKRDVVAIFERPRISLKKEVRRCIVENNFVAAADLQSPLNIAHAHAMGVDAIQEILATPASHFHLFARSLTDALSIWMRDSQGCYGDYVRAMRNPEVSFGLQDALFGIGIASGPSLLDCVGYLASAIAGSQSQAKAMERVATYESAIINIDLYVYESVLGGLLPALQRDGYYIR